MLYIYIFFCTLYLYTIPYFKRRSDMRLLQKESNQSIIIKKGHLQIASPMLPEPGVRLWDQHLPSISNFLGEKSTIPKPVPLSLSPAYLWKDLSVKNLPVVKQNHCSKGDIEYRTFLKDRKTPCCETITQMTVRTYGGSASSWYRGGNILWTKIAHENLKNLSFTGCKSHRLWKSLESLWPWECTTCQFGFTKSTVRLHLARTSLTKVKLKRFLTSHVHGKQKFRKWVSI